MATPEKALCDKVIATSGINLRSQLAAQNFVMENFRIEEIELAKFDTKSMESWLDYALKRGSLEMLIKMIKKL